MAEGPTTTELVLEVLQAIALFALQQERVQFEQGIDPDHGDDFQRLGGNALGEPEVTRLKEGIGVTKGRCIKLPAKKKDGVWWAPLLWITAKEANDADTDHLLQLVIGGTERLFGFRWEPPEGTGEGQHDYWHAQPIISVRTIHNSLLDLNIPIGATCTHAPAFPLYVDNRLSLIDALFVALYGPDYLKEYVEEANLRDRIRRNVKRSWESTSVDADRADRKGPPKGSKKPRK